MISSSAAFDAPAFTSALIWARRAHLRKDSAPAFRGSRDRGVIIKQHKRHAHGTAPYKSRISVALDATLIHPVG